MSTPQRGSGSRQPGSGTQDRLADGPPFTPGMRDRQARGKNPYGSGRTGGGGAAAAAAAGGGYDGSEEESSEEEAGRGGRKMRLGQGLSSDSFEDREKRAFALSVLDDREQLMMYAQSTNDSIPGQRHRFTAMLCGFEAPPQTQQQQQHKHDAGAKSSSRREAQEASGQKAMS